MLLSLSPSRFDFCCVPTVKPRRPEVQNITINQESNQVVIYIRTPYEQEYIKVKNQLFQVLIHSPTDSKVWLRDLRGAA